MNQPDVAGDERRAGMPGQVVEAAGDGVGQQPIVGIEEQQERAAAVRQAAVAGGRRPGVPLVQVADAAMRGRHPRRVVRRAVVDASPRPPRASGDGRSRWPRPDRPLAGDYDRDERRRHRHAPPARTRRTRATWPTACCSTRCSHGCGTGGALPAAPPAGRRRRRAARPGRPRATRDSAGTPRRAARRAPPCDRPIRRAAGSDPSSHRRRRPHGAASSSRGRPGRCRCGERIFPSADALDRVAARQHAAHAWDRPASLQECDQHPRWIDRRCRRHAESPPDRSRPRSFGPTLQLVPVLGAAYTIAPSAVRIEQRHLLLELGRQVDVVGVEEREMLAAAHRRAPRFLEALAPLLARRVRRGSVSSPGAPWLAPGRSRAASVEPSSTSSSSHWCRFAPARFRWLPG